MADPWERLLRPGMLVLDIGANIGSYTQRFLDAVGPTGAVVAIEPDGRAVSDFHAKGPSLSLLHAAVRERNGPAELYHS